MKRDELTILQALPLNIKIAKSKLRIEEWIRHHGRDKIYISFSGGKDSTVVAKLVREVEFMMFGDNTIPLVFSNTGLEYKELVEFAMKQENIIMIRPKINFTEVIKRYGYPVVSKNTSANIYKLKENNLSERYRNYLLNGDERGSYGTVPKKWQHLIDSDFKIGAGCCDVMKKRPMHQYEKETGRNCPFTGEMAEESRLRTKQYLEYGCNAFTRKKGFKSTPLGFWTQNDILEYIYNEKLEIASVYGDVVIDSYKELDGGLRLPQFKTTGENRTGYCIAV
ncbi:MAG: phosphoadenosine phosphosulfate reductase family protein [Clostridium sp.]|uniref:phosphoadenosine phosphosulfate reductase domain-containing protein n=1 Tax=Clostridium sp. TaxID=1506 RepID=UPI003EE60AEF